MILIFLFATFSLSALFKLTPQENETIHSKIVAVNGGQVNNFFVSEKEWQGLATSYVGKLNQEFVQKMKKDKQKELEILLSPVSTEKKVEITPKEKISPKKIKNNKIQPRRYFQ